LSLNAVYEGALESATREIPHPFEALHIAGRLLTLTDNEATELL